MSDRIVIYVAGPYSGGDPVQNTHAAIKAGDAVWDAGGCPVIPHLSLAWHFVSPAPYEVWLERDLGVLARCHGLIRLPGESSGADAEVQFALDRGLVVAASDGTPSGAYRAAKSIIGRATP